jgi:hypothetical protein
MVNYFAGDLGGAYVVGPIRHCFLDFRDLLHPRLIHRFVQGSDLVQEGLYLSREGRFLRGERAG